MRIKKEERVKEVVGCKHDGLVTLMFFDTIVAGGEDLYHRAFYAGVERRACVDENQRVYLVAIDEKEENADMLFEMVETTRYMLKEHFKIDFSEYQEYWMTDEPVFRGRATKEEKAIYDYVLFNEGQGE